MLLSTTCDSLWLFQNFVPSVSFSIWETKRNHRVLSPASREDWIDNHAVVSHKFWGFQGRVGGHVVVMKGPVVDEPKFWSFLSHIFSQPAQNITVNVRVDCSVRRNNFMVNNPLHEKKKKKSMPFTELRTCHTNFALGDCGLFRCNDYRFVSGS
jgi:hypothetical protein